MRTKSKDQKIFNKFKKQYKFIFNNKNFLTLTNNHFNSNGGFVGILIAFLANRVGEEKIKNHLQINSEDWIELFSHLYLSQNIKDVYEGLEVNPAIDLEKITIQFKCFDDFINRLIEFLKTHEINVNIAEPKFKEILKNVFGYILYNCVESKMYYNFDQILNDPEYDSKLVTISNNTKLFSIAKASIIEYCGDKINDLIVLLLGQSKALNYDK